MNHPDGTVDDWRNATGVFYNGVPRTWDFFDKLPTAGIFSCKYNSAPEDRSYSERCRLMQKFGFWVPPAESDVKWWASISQCPLDVVELVEFLFTKFKHNAVAKAFKLLVGEDSSGNTFNLRGFEDGLEKMQCTKFNGKDKSERIKNIFRYLDPSGEGQVSEGEWDVLKQLYSEIQLSIKEFVDFCERTFGDDLTEAWNRLDADQSGEIDEREWHGLCQELGFFGPTEPIFNYLDTDDQGTISRDEFNLLQTFQSKKKRKAFPDTWNPIGISEPTAILDT
mmetsp:Transcript_54722/g.86916  ORF Transcript_54722/g.86916 Transcript_54722/m.86916 type:complete len:280 (+) Transcript_54722:3-842(+)